MYSHTCSVCKKQFNAIHKNRVCCSRKCYFLTRLGENNPLWKGGGKQFTNFGYTRVTTPYDHPWRKQSKHNGYFIFEHRLIMEKHLGRYLKPTELVHHINGIKTDNRVENLVVITKRGHNKTHLDSPISICRVPNCGRKYCAKGFCNTHYWQYNHKGKWKDLYIKVRK